MGFKSKVRSMQRGAARRGLRPSDPTPDYQNFDPILRDADRLQLGANYSELEATLKRLGPKIEAYARGGYRKPAEVARLLNKERIRTARGTSWTPRLAWFLLGVYYGRKAEQKRVPKKGRDVSGDTQRRKEPQPERNLTAEEMQRRLVALKAHWAGN